MSLKHIVVPDVAIPKLSFYTGDNDNKPTTLFKSTKYTWNKGMGVEWLQSISGNDEYNHNKLKLGVVNWSTQYNVMHDSHIITLTIIWNTKKTLVWEATTYALEHIKPDLFFNAMFHGLGQELRKIIPCLSVEDAFRALKQAWPFDANLENWPVTQGIANNKPEFDVASASKELPGVMTQTNYPCECLLGKDYVRSIIIHLNDSHMNWSRNDIADWLDKLHDEGIINIEFSPWEDPEEDTTEREKYEDTN